VLEDVMNRRDLFEAAVWTLAGITGALVFAGCGSDGDDPEPTAEGCGSADITLNHGHTLVLTAADLESTEPITRSIQGDSPHDHTVTLMPADLEALRNGEDVVVASSDGAAHTHTVTVRC
jgi:hypothetical protein